ncbi:MAG: hypothetical protein MAG451_02118 [Anaerolineales bacterium]|nr:hypothetical protein [Anaerolineales bacterium]
MPSPFPGMDPYLEHPDLWPDVHHGLIEALRSDLAPALRPRYRVVVEKRTYRVDPSEVVFIGRPDVGAIRTVQEPAELYAAVEPGGPLTVEVPVPDVVEVGYLEVRDLSSGEVVTVLELLSPANKRPGEGRRLYDHKRLTILGSLTHLVEIDLLRAYEPMLVYGDEQESHYRILVSRSERRPRADLLTFNVQDPISAFHLPLRRDDEEPLVDLGRLLHELYDRAGYDLSVDYELDPVPPLEDEDAEWVTQLLAAWRKGEQFK